MKKQATTGKAQSRVEVDKRELVNIDLYNHEMELIVDQLKKISKKHRQSKEIHQKVEHLRKELKAQQKNLEKFRKDCQPEEMNNEKQTGKKREQPGDKSFFDKLKGFENQFKTVRQEANDFVNMVEIL